MAKKEEFPAVIKHMNQLGFKMRPVATAIKKFAGLDENGRAVGDPKPVALPVRMPTMEQRIARMEHAGMMRQAFYDEHLNEMSGDWSGLHPDDFQDELDDVPAEGLSRYEEHDIKHKAREARNAKRKAADEAKKKAATPPSDDDKGSTTAKPKSSSAAS